MSAIKQVGDEFYCVCSGYPSLALDTEHSLFAETINAETDFGIDVAFAAIRPAVNSNRKNADAVQLNIGRTKELKWVLSAVRIELRKIERLKS